MVSDTITNRSQPFTLEGKLNFEDRAPVLEQSQKSTIMETSPSVLMGSRNPAGTSTSADITNSFSSRTQSDSIGRNELGKSGTATGTGGTMGAHMMGQRTIPLVESGSNSHAEERTTKLAGTKINHSVSENVSTANSAVIGNAAYSIPSRYSTRSWHEKPEEDVELRRIVISEIVTLLESCKPKAFVDRQEKLVDLARRLEVALYKQSKTIEEYMDRRTLRHRVRELAKQSTSHETVRNIQQAGPHVQHPAGAVYRQQGLNAHAPGSMHGMHNFPRPLTAQEQEQRNQILKQRQQRLLLLKHASRCIADEDQCAITPHCAAMKRLWKHIPGCKDTVCSVPHCVSSRYVLSHFHRCKNEECPVCKPVKIMSQRNMSQEGHIRVLQQAQLSNGGQAGSKENSQTRVNRGGDLYRGGAYQGGKQLSIEQQRAQAIDPRMARHCVSGTGPSLPLSFKRDRVEKHVQSLRVERIQMAVTPLLRKLFESKHNKGVFNEPVDYVALNIPDYPKIVKRPMDLGTIRRKLDRYEYKTLDQFRDDVVLVFNNGIRFNPPENDYHVRAQNLLKLAETEMPKIVNKIERDGRKRGENCRLCFQPTCTTCPLCERGCISFEPKALFCSGVCTQRIARNAVYYTGVGNNLCWCSDCFDKSKGGTVACNNTQKTYDKNQLLKRKNDERYGEPWVNCDICEKWMHQICALFNARKNIPGSTQQYMCPICLIKESKLGEAERVHTAGTKTTMGEGKFESERNGVQRTNGSAEKKGLATTISTKPPLGPRTSTSIPNSSAGGQPDANVKGKYKHIVLPADKPVPSAESLDETRLSVYLQKWVRDRIEKFLASERDEFSKSQESGGRISESDLDPGPGAEKIRVRVLSNYDEVCKVKPFVKSLLPKYCSEFNYRSRCIMLFQEMDGVDVLFFMMFVQEYGSNCLDPNRRKVYIAYLDSVYYFRPRRMRTMVYHEVLLGYLEYVRRCGFNCAYIWACPPPNKRDDYIIHCHPEDQRVQTADRLRKWYQEMIRVGSAEHVFLGSCTLFEEHFEGIPRPASKNKKKGGKNKSKTKGTKKGFKGVVKGRGMKGKTLPVPAVTRRSSGRSIGGLSTAYTVCSASAMAEMDAERQDDYFEMDDDEMEDNNNFFPDLPDVVGEDEDEEKTTRIDDDSCRDMEEKCSDDGEGFRPSSKLVWPGNGLMAGDDRMLPEDIERRKATKLCAAGKIPYFEGDYWPQEAEDLARDRDRELKKQKASKESFATPSTINEDGRCIRKRRQSYFGMDESNSEDKESEKLDGGASTTPGTTSNSQLDASSDDAAAAKDLKMSPEEVIKARTQLVQRLSGQLDAMKDDFLVIKIAHECMRCGSYLLRGRWECRHRDCRANSGFSKPCPFALCNACYVRECKRPLGHQHGGGCIAPGDAGIPRSEEEQKMMDLGDDQVLIDVNEEAKRKLAKEKAETKEKLEAKVKTQSSDPDKKGVSVESTDSNVKNSSDVMNANCNNTAVVSANMEIDKNEESLPQNENSDAVPRKKRIPEEDSQAERRHFVQGSSTPVSVDASSSTALAVKNSKVEGDPVASKETSAFEKEAKASAEAAEKKKKYQAQLAEWQQQEVTCTRDVALDGNTHTLHYVDENLPVKTPDHDVFMKNHLLETRHAFLSLCTGNRYQFDQLRRAKHSTMMVLYHLHNPDAPAHLYTCAACEKDILEGKRYHCDLCNNGDYDLCSFCRRDVKHQHPLTSFVVTRGVNAETSEAQRIQLVTEMRRARKHSLTLFLQALVHSSTCTDPACGEAPCKKMKDLLKHRMECLVRVRGGCEVCRRVLCLVQMHARTCKISQCRVPHCEDLKTHIQQQVEQAKLRHEQMQLQTQQQMKFRQHNYVNSSRPQSSNLSGGNSVPSDSSESLRGLGRSKGRGRSGFISSHQQTGNKGPMQATVVEGSGGTRLKIRPAVKLDMNEVGGMSRSRGRGRANK